MRDYHAAGHGAEATLALEALRALPYQGLLDFDRLSELLGYPRGTSSIDTSVQPRGYRILSHIPRLPEPLVGRVVADFQTLDTVACGPHSAISRPWRAWAPSGRARSARACDASRSTISSTATSSSSAAGVKNPEKVAFPRVFC